MSGTSQLVRYKKGKHHFEILTKPGSVLLYRENPTKMSLSDVLLTNEIYKNHSKFERANTKELTETFSLKDENEILELIVTKGELQVSTAERKAAMDLKKAEIVHYIHKNYVDPKTHLPHPIARLETALEDSKLRVNADASAERQAAEFIKLITGKLMFKKSEMEGTLKIAHQYVGSANNIIHGMARVLSENYGAEGCEFVLGVAPGDFDGFMSALNKVTKGDYSFVLKNAPVEVPEEKSGKKKKKKGKGRK